MDLETVQARVRALTELEVEGRSSGHMQLVAGEHLYALCAAMAGALESGVPKLAVIEAIAPARAALSASPFMRRCQEWPRGYPGDFETIEYLWQAQNTAPKGTVGHAIEAFCLGTPPPQQHRNKVVAQAQLIAEVCRRVGPGARILSVASGGCPDLRLIETLLQGQGHRFTLVDQDADALAFARSKLPLIADDCDFVCEDIRNLTAILHGQSYDLILAGGLFDYLPDGVISFILAAAYHQHLRPGGELFFTNFSNNNPYRVLMRYLVSWRLIERGEEALRALCDAAAIPPERVAITPESTGLAYLIRIRGE